MPTSSETKPRKKRLAGAVDTAFTQAMESTARQSDEGATPTIGSAAVLQTSRRDSTARLIRLSAIDPDPDQPRKVRTDTEDFLGLVDSIREHGVISPITVRLVPGTDRYQIITGERRYHAVKRLGLEEIPAIIKDVDDTKKAIHQIVENLQREDMNPVEEARALHRLVAAGKTQKELAKDIGKSEAYVSQLMGLQERLTIQEQDQLARLSPAKLPGKSLILEALRASDRKTRQAILFGSMTRTEARKAVKKQAGGRPRQASKTLAIPDSPYTVVVRSKNSQISDEEVFNALQAASMEQAKLLGNQDS